MRRIRVFAHVSLDGVVSPESENSDWANGGWTAPYRSPEGAALVAEAQGTGFDLLLGRHTYDLWSGFWPKAPSSPIADSLNAATKHVVTHRPEGLGWGPVSNLGAGGLRGLKSCEGPDLIVWGSTTVTPVLFREGLVDDVVLCVHPVLLGRGKRLFPEGVDPRELAFVRSQGTPTGILMNTYRSVGPVQVTPGK
jgi:dihydrofolate reductase